MAHATERDTKWSSSDAQLYAQLYGVLEGHVDISQFVQAFKHVLGLPPRKHPTGVSKALVFAHLSRCLVKEDMP